MPSKVNRVKSLTRVLAERSVCRNRQGWFNVLIPIVMYVTRIMRRSKTRFARMTVPVSTGNLDMIKDCTQTAIKITKLKMKVIIREFISSGVVGG